MTEDSTLGVILKYSIPVDGTKHPVPWGRWSGTYVTGVEVRATEPGVVDIWVLHPRGIATEDCTRHFSVVGTGHPFDAGDARVIGSTRHPETQLVWHVIGHLV
jgi:hypothetical protein